MKKQTVILLAFLMPFLVKGQRFLQPVFDSVLVTPDILFGSNTTYKGDTLALALDIYEPYGDTLSERPLVVLAHGGSFIQGSRKAADISTVCKELARRGYVCVSIQYRLGVSLSGANTLETEFKMAVWRAVQDARAAIRFMRKNQSEANTWKINPNEVYAGGISAGGVIGLHLAFLDQPQEISMLSIDTIALGGAEGNSGTPGYSWKVKGIISLCGAIGNVSWMGNNTEISICSMHGTNDNTVPYKTDYFTIFGADVSILQGGFSVDSAAQKSGMDTRLYTFNGADHVPFSGTTATQMAYMDTTIDYVSRYLYRHVTGLVPDGIRENENKTGFALFPNPATEELFIAAESSDFEGTVEVADLTGKTILRDTIRNGFYKWELGSQAKGLYFIRITGRKVIYNTKVQVN